MTKPDHGNTEMYLGNTNTNKSFLSINTFFKIDNSVWWRNIWRGL